MGNKPRIKTPNDLPEWWFGVFFMGLIMAYALLMMFIWSLMP